MSMNEQWSVSKANTPRPEHSQQQCDPNFVQRAQFKQLQPINGSDNFYGDNFSPKTTSTATLTTCTCCSDGSMFQTICRRYSYYKTRLPFKWILRVCFMMAAVCLIAVTAATRIDGGAVWIFKNFRATLSQDTEDITGTVKSNHSETKLEDIAATQEPELTASFEDLDKVRDPAQRKQFVKQPISVSVFEWNIRYVGGLLSAFALTNDEMFKTKAKQAADYLLPAFNSSSGIPYTRVSKLGLSFSAGNSILAEIGTLHLEFEYLSFITENKTYASKVRKIREVLMKKPKKHGLYVNIIPPDKPNSQVTTGGMFALYAHNDDSLDFVAKDHYLNLGKGLAKACHEGYVKTSTGLGPDNMAFFWNRVSSYGGYYQRPEAVESWLYLWRITKDRIYREWAWDFVKAIEKHTKTASGYTGLQNVNDPLSRDFAMQSFFLRNHP